MNTTAKRLKEGMELRCLKQSDMVERTGISKGALSSYLSGRYVPKQNNIYLLAKALNVNEAWLMGADVPMEKQNYEDTLTADADQKKIFAKNLNKYLTQFNKTQKEVADAIDVSPQTFNTWCQGIALPRMGKVQRLADYFGIGKTDLIDEKDTDTLTPRDERDIKKDLDSIMEKIEAGEDSPLYYNGDEVDKESMELLRDAIGMSLRHLKIINKEKYNPHKNKK